MEISSLIEVLVQFILGSTLIYFSLLVFHPFMMVISSGVPPSHIAWFWSMLSKYKSIRDAEYGEYDEKKSTQLHKIVGLLFSSLIIALTLTIGSFVLTLAEWSIDSSSFEGKKRAYLQTAFQFVIENETKTRIDSIFEACPEENENSDSANKDTDSGKTRFFLSGLGKDIVNGFDDKYSSMGKNPVNRIEKCSFSLKDAADVANQIYYDAIGKYRYLKIEDSDIRFWRNIDLIFLGMSVIFIYLAIPFILSILVCLFDKQLEARPFFGKTMALLSISSICIWGHSISSETYYENIIGLYASYWNDKESEEKLKIGISVNQNRELKWMLESSEYSALTNKIYSSAESNITQAKKTTNANKGNVVVMDFDETIYSNLIFEKTISQKNNIFDSQLFCDMALLSIKGADGSLAYFVPGSKGFLKFLANENIKLLIVTKRQDCQSIAVIDLINTLFVQNGLPKIAKDQLFIVQESKNDILLDIQKNNVVLAWFGDNCFDFSQNVNSCKGFKLEDNQYLIPNPRYGDWMSKK